ncbi:oncoprotein E6 [Oryctolagus cuniculus papillomavirus 1]|uniref:Protein E6 n=1 Tax=Oryctolagus cuniculus papillomavirus 1 TaxID=2772507 RepID=Q9J032_9PAPI|nr:oncoprotein E6 [Oryctolagus cuniculus papillomavirus 1]AAF67121.1 oncoprotein E6 [Oryctolagus cuniculus papillomavirus 1]
MEEPRTLVELCDRLNCTFESLNIPCIFCSAPLSLGDKALFDFSQLKLVWRDGWPHGSCRVCCRYFCYMDLVFNLDYINSWSQIEALFNQDIAEWFMRCTCCARVLTTSDKIDLKSENRDLFRIVSYSGTVQWRALCGPCRRGVGTLPQIPLLERPLPTQPLCNCSFCSPLLAEAAPLVTVDSGGGSRSAIPTGPCDCEECSGNRTPDGEEEPGARNTSSPDSSVCGCPLCEGEIINV